MTASRSTERSITTSFNARLAEAEDRIDRRLAKHDADIVELQDKVDFFVRTSQPPVYGGLTLKTSTYFHDRFLVIDDKRLYLIGASLKDLGWKCFAFTQLDASEIVGLKSRI